MLYLFSYFGKPTFYLDSIQIQNLQLRGRYLLPSHPNVWIFLRLINNYYNELAKVLSTRLRCVIESVISKSQSFFAHGRKILDGILIANELVDETRCLKKEMFLFKVDFEKAFDSVDWRYLNAIMTKMNFLVIQRNWIMEWITTTFAYVLVNGFPTYEFHFK